MGVEVTAMSLFLFRDGRSDTISSSVVFYLSFRHRNDHLHPSYNQSRFHSSSPHSIASNRYRSEEVSRPFSSHPCHT